MVGRFEARFGRRAVLGGLATGLAAGCAPLTVLDTLTPKDGGANLIRRDVAYGAHRRQRLDLYAPERAALVEPDKAAPIILFIYGGSWNSGRKEDYSFVGRALASRGFITAICDYRLVPEIRFPVFIEDCAQAAAFTRDLAAEVGGDPARFVVAGHSAGAYIAMMLALDGRYLEAVGARSLIKAAAGLAGPYDFLPLDVEATIEAFGQAPDLTLTQPVNFVTPSAPPAFLAHGLGDTLVYPKNTIALAKKLRAANARVEERLYPKLTHADLLLALAPPFRSKAPVLAEMTNFLRSAA